MKKLNLLALLLGFFVSQSSFAAVSYFNCIEGSGRNYSLRVISDAGIMEAALVTLGSGEVAIPLENLVKTEKGFNIVYPEGNVICLPKAK